MCISSRLHPPPSQRFKAFCPAVKRKSGEGGRAPRGRGNCYFDYDDDNDEEEEERNRVVVVFMLVVFTRERGGSNSPVWANGCIHVRYNVE